MLGYERVFLLELSGPTIDFLRERIDHLPNFRRCLERGAWSRLRGPLQPVAPTSFATLLTGKNPGKTGLFDLFRMRAGGYERRGYARDQLQGGTMLEHLSGRGKRVGVLNVPLMDPLPQLRGFVVAGDEGVGQDFARPPEIADALRMDGYSVPFGASYAPGRELEFLDHAGMVIKSRHQAFRKLFSRGGLDFGMLTLHAYGELLHAFWKFYDDRHPEYQLFEEVFEGRDPFLEGLVAVDAILGDVIEWAGSSGLVLALGAWGHRVEHSRLHLNTVLSHAGHLKFRLTPRVLGKRVALAVGLSKTRAEQLAHRLNVWKHFHYGMRRDRRASLVGAAFLSFDDIDWRRTRAFAMGYLGQVFLNVAGHRPQGPIAPTAYEAERRVLSDYLSRLRDPRTGEAVVDRVFTREELYHGLDVTHAPDLIVHCRDGYSADDAIGERTIVTSSPANHSSDHWNESFLLVHGQGVRAGQIDAQLEDVAPTVLHALGVPLPADLDGHTLPILKPA